MQPRGSGVGERIRGRATKRPGFTRAAPEEFLGAPRVKQAGKQICILFPDTIASSFKPTMR